MSRQKKILISLPDTLLTEVDSLALARNVNRSEFIREAMRQYIHQKKKADLNDELKKGYEAMSEINLEIAEFCFSADDIQQRSYEEKLAECE